MTVDRVEEIREQLEESKEQRTRAQVKIEDIENTWKQEYGVTGLDGAKELKETTQDQIDTLTKKEEKLEDEIESLLDQMEEEDD